MPVPELIELSTDTVSILHPITNHCSKSLKRIKTRCCALPSVHPRDIYLDQLDVEVHNVHNLRELLEEKCYRTKSLTLDLFNNISCSDLVTQFDGVYKWVLSFIQREAQLLTPPHESMKHALTGEGSDIASPPSFFNKSWGEKRNWNKDVLFSQQKAFLTRNETNFLRERRVNSSTWVTTF